MSLGLLSRLTPMMLNPKRPYFVINSFSAAMSALHGSHQLAQYWINTTLPRNAASLTWSPAGLFPSSEIDLPIESSRVRAPEAFLAGADVGNSSTTWAYHFFASSS